MIFFDSYVYEVCHYDHNRTNSVRPDIVFADFNRKTRISASNKERFIEVTSERISSIYAACFTSKWQEKRAELQALLGKHNEMPRDFPSLEEVIYFKESLKNKIKELLGQRNKTMVYVSLETDTGPIKLLDKALYQSGIGGDGRRMQTYLFLMQRSHTHISIINEKKLSIQSNFIDSETPQLISKLWLEQDEISPTPFSIDEGQEISRETSFISSSSSGSPIISKNILQAAKIDPLTKRNMRLIIRYASICLIAFCTILALNCIREKPGSLD